MSRRVVAEGELLWAPSLNRVRSCRMSDYIGWLRHTRGYVFDDYPSLHAFSTQNLPCFWGSIWDYFGVRSESTVSERVRGTMPHVQWFDGARLNYAAHALSRRDGRDALIFRSESEPRQVLSRSELAHAVARARAGLRRLGVGVGDRVAALVTNRPEAVIGFLACASLGAIWSSCSPEFGASSVLDRFQQIAPKVLLASSSYVYGGKRFDRSAELARVRAGLPSLAATVHVGEAREGMLGWDELLAEEEPLEFEPVGFEHPLWILYSSGTTGLPKAIVHGHGGMLLEHLKALALHLNLDQDDRFFWFTTTGWMMWNFLISGLLLGTTVVLYDGSPAYPDLNALFRLVEEESITYFGSSAPHLLACKKAGIVPARAHKLSSLKGLGSTGAPLSAEGFAWVYENVHRDLALGSLSGGTDVCTAFVLPCPLLPVHAGEIQCAGLGAAVEAFDETGCPVVDEVGELVLTEPMPCMPVSFWNDPNDKRRIKSYFDSYAGVWRHGDWIKQTSRGSFVIYGRSDATLNRGGVRMGTAEFYRVVESLPEFVDSLVVDTSALGDGAEGAEAGKLWLFVVLAPGAQLDDALKGRLRERIRQDLSPRHVPDEILAVSVVPRTLNGKKMEIPVKGILQGQPPDKVAAPGTLQDPHAFDFFVQLAQASNAAAR
ncbi:MAG TPA: acetoacetate--CoA ligase [Polyangiaceae bacterium]|nr:acetoacetate--CoA ligase [Polyangiaceae bacterium]